ncbi:hypothetical protein XarbCFBP8147_21195 [Xanthomonas arboricola]|nr:hypothetical protein XarbCFBP8147_21195 [Xanthomonas arboricola]
MHELVPRAVGKQLGPQLLRIIHQLSFISPPAAPSSYEGTLGAPAIPLRQWAQCLWHLSEQLV